MNTTEQISKNDGMAITKTETLVKFFVGISEGQFSNPALAKVKRVGSKIVFTVDFGMPSVSKGIYDVIQKFYNGDMDDHPSRIGKSPYLDGNKFEFKGSAS